MAPMSVGNQRSRGAVGASVPGFGPIVVSAMEMLDLSPELAPMNGTGPLWVLLYLCTSIRMTVFPAGRPVHMNLAPGSAVLLPMHTRYRIDTRPHRAPGHHYWMQMDCVDAEPRFTAMVDEQTHCTRFTDHKGALARRLAATVDAVEEQRNEPFWVMQAHGYGIMRLLTSAVRGPDGIYGIDESEVPAPDHLVNRALAFMKDNISKRIRLVDIARHVHASPSTISHRYRAATGEAPIQTLHRMRMLQAKRLVLQGATLRQIADELGFYDEHHFSRAFRKTEGLAPLRFAQKAGSQRPMLGPRPA